MGAQALKERGVGSDPVSVEARERIEDARVRDVAFSLRKVVGPTIESSDLTLIAEIILSGLDDPETASGIGRQFLIDGLMKAGRSRHKSEHLAASVFKR